MKTQQIVLEVPRKAVQGESRKRVRPKTIVTPSMDGLPLHLQLLSYVTQSPGATYQEMAVSFEVSVRSVRIAVKGLQKQKLVRCRIRHQRTEVAAVHPAVWSPSQVDPLVLHCADLFCGGGGFSSGMAKALEELKRNLGMHVDLVAINHSETAIATHQANHRWARHVKEDIAKALPRQLFPAGKLHLLLASPSCTHFSTARGGKPVDPQLRSHAWQVVRWARDLDIDCIIVENVKELTSWGPTRLAECKCRLKRKDGKFNAKCKYCSGLGKVEVPIKDGAIFRAWIKELELLGYTFNYDAKRGHPGEILNAADYGDATSRNRYFLVATKGHEAIPRPVQTHSKVGADGKPTVPGTLPWRGAKEILDLTKQGESIFLREDPLVVNTLKRIAEGVRRFSGLDLEEFLMEYYTVPSDGKCYTYQVEDGDEEEGQPCIDCGIEPDEHLTRKDRPKMETKAQRIARLSSVLAAGGDVPAEDAQFLVKFYGTSSTQSIQEPLGTVTAGGKKFGLVTPSSFVVDTLGSKDAYKSRTKSIEDPLGAVTGSNRWALADLQAFLLGQQSGGAPRSVKEPMPTIATGGAISMVTPAPFILPPNGIMGGVERPNAPRSLDDPMQTITASRGGGHLVQPFGLHLTHGGRVHDLDKPLPTVTGANRGEMAISGLKPYIIPYQSERPAAPGKKGRKGKGQKPRTHDVDDPLPTVTGQGAGALVQPQLVRFVQEYYGNGKPHSLEAPLPTVTTKERFAIIEPRLVQITPETQGVLPVIFWWDGEAWQARAFDILFRMVEPEELARAMGFDETYQWSGNKTEVVKQIGNAVAVHMAKALCLAALRGIGVTTTGIRGVAAA